MTDSLADARTVPVTDGRTVACAEYGVAEGTPVVLLHGTPGSRVLGELFADAAREQGVRLLAVDRPGSGRSSPWPGRSLADTAAVVASVLDDAGVEEAGLVGFSGGAPHALAVAGARPGRVRSVDLVAGATPPSLGPADPPVQRLLGTLAGTTPRLLAWMLRGQAWALGRASPSAVVDLYTAGDADVPAGVADGQDGDADVPVGVADVVARDFQAALAHHRRGTVTDSRLAAERWLADLPPVDVPVRVRHGERDTNVPVAGARQLADHLPTATLTVREDADHLGTLLACRSAVLRRQVEGSTDGGGRHSPATGSAAR